MRLSSSKIFFIILTFFTAVNFFLLKTFTTKSKLHDSCVKANTFIEKIISFIQSNGKVSLQDEIDVDVKYNKILTNAIENFATDCEHDRSLQKKHSKANNSIITIFSTFSLGKKDAIQNRTLRTWRKLHPRVKLVLFTNEIKLKKFALYYDWDVLPITHHAAGGVPVLKHMFSEIMKYYDTPFYAYSNGDILFDDSIIRTLDDLKDDHKMHNIPSMIIGRRVNVMNVKNSEVSTLQSIRDLAQKRGELFYAYAQDYFITSKHFPWELYPELVVGRSGIDNWIIGQAFRTNITLVDTSKTILAVHQTAEKGNWESQVSQNANYNIKLIEKLNLPGEYGKGWTNCARYWSYLTFCGRIQLEKRTKFAHNCLTGETHPVV